jgi:hypothetical protein
VTGMENVEHAVGQHHFLAGVPEGARPAPRLLESRGPYA